MSGCGARDDGGAFHAVGDALARGGQHRQLINMQAGALQAFIQGLRRFAGRRFQRAQEAPAPAIAMLSSPMVRDRPSWPLRTAASRRSSTMQ